MEETKYTYEEALAASIEYFDGDSLAANVWLNKYALKDSDGHIYELSPTDMHRRLASEIARVEKKYKNPLSEDEIFDLIDKFKYLVPQGGPMSGIGNTKQIVSLSNCFVVGNEFDSYGGIMHTDQEQVQLMKRRGGVGHDLSHLRPSGVKVNNSALSSTGLPSFMERFSNSTREVAQDGRRGALMLSCFHKDTLVLTDSGWIRIIDVIRRIAEGESFKAWTHEGFKDITETQTIEDKELYEVEVESGKTVTVTGDHEFMVQNTETGEEYLKELLKINSDIEHLVLYEE